MQTQLSLFDNNSIVYAPPTQSIKYVGSKLKLLPLILDLARRVDAVTVFDAFAGTTRVSQAFAKLGYKVYCNDSAVWSQILGSCYLLAQKPTQAYQGLIDHLNNVKPVEGWFTEHYGGLPNGGCAIQSDGMKRPWQIHNTKKLDGIRNEIELLRLNPIDKSVALTSLMLALDEVDSTLGHFVSYLKDWSARSYKQLKLTVPSIFLSGHEHEVSCADVFDAANHIDVDLAYFDPPYGSNNEKMPASRVRYASYYHIWKSVCLFDQIELFGKSKRRADTSDRTASSVFEEFRRNGSGRFIAVEAIERLIKKVRARWIIMSYSSGGRATAGELHEVIAANGKLLDTVEVTYKKNVMAAMRWTNEWLRDANLPNREFLFLIEKN